MKCGKCGNNEATFHYKSMINGNVTELHLCPECAAGEEFAGLFDMRSGEEIFGRSFMYPFAHAMNAFANPGSFLNSGFGAPTMPSVPYRTERTVPEAVPEASEDKIPKGVDPELAKRRELHAMKFELKKAVEAEEYEKAAELRDRIRGLEGTGG